MSEKKGQANWRKENCGLEVNTQVLFNCIREWLEELRNNPLKFILAGRPYTIQVEKTSCPHTSPHSLEREREIHNQVLFHLRRIQELDSVPPPSETKTDSQLLSSVPAQRCLEKGVSDGMGLKANKIVMEKNHEVCHSKKGQPNGGLKSDALKVNQQCLSNHTQADSLGINIEKPKFPQYAGAAKRKDSYKNWPAHLNIDPAEMIDAGLFFTGVNDSVRCYHCGGRLRNWEITDDPWEEHAKWYPSCSHVRLVKGQDYIERVGRGERPEPDCVPPPQPENKTDNQLLSTVPAQSCLENGYSEAMVLKAIKIFMENNHGSTEFKAADIAEIILDLDDDGVDASPVFNCCEKRDCGQNCEPRESSQEKDAVLVSGEVEQLYLENQRLKENQMCKICLDDVANVIFLPCGHMASCPQCAPALVKCPLCRLVIEDTVKAYSE